MSARKTRELGTDNWWTDPEEKVEVEIDSVFASSERKMSFTCHWASKHHGWGTFTLRQREVGVDGKMAYDLDAEKMPREFIAWCLVKLVAEAKVR